MEPILEVEHVSHHYGVKQSVDDLSFSVKGSEVLGLLGQNGAGKTTTIRLINGLLKPTSGRISVLGLDPIEDGSLVRRQTGVLTETPALYERLTPLQNLHFFGTLSGMTERDIQKRSQELLSFFNLTERAGDRVATYSKGMKQRLALARALLHKPKVLFLDEPTSGLDPEAAQQVHDLIISLRRESGQTVILCTHNLYEAERLCERMAIIKHGQLLALGTLDDLRRQFQQGVVVRIGLWQSPRGVDWAETIRSFQGVNSAEYNPILSDLIVNVSAEEVIPRLVGRLVENGAGILSVQPKPISLEEIYFKLQANQTGGEK